MSFGWSGPATRAWDRRSPYRRDVAHQHLEYSFQSQAPSKARESRLSRHSGRVGIFVISGRRDRGACGPQNQVNPNAGAARRKVIHHRRGAPNPGGASSLVNNFGGTIRVGIETFMRPFLGFRYHHFELTQALLATTPPLLATTPLSKVLATGSEATFRRCVDLRLKSESSG